jgi:UDP-2,3-diacylglucosamine pyrophosphatase LpxH
MSDLLRQVFVISDLHLGGAYADPGTPGRGFRICTHAREVAAFIDALAAKPVGPPKVELVVNGDLVDFLAETDSADKWEPFTYDQATAVQKLEAIMRRDRVVFDALGRFVAAGHRLVILLGNHDIELAMPLVRLALAGAIGAERGADYEMVRYDEAYVVGDALIEHGNRYDAWNAVSHDGLQRLCALASRGQTADGSVFHAPAGSQLVAEMMNPVKEQYKFVDLLKPETGAVVPLLLALEPGFRKVLGRIALLAAKPQQAVRLKSSKPQSGTSDVGVADLGEPFGSDISATTSVASTPTNEDDALDAVLREKLGDSVADIKSVLEAVPHADAFGGDISTFREFVDRSAGMMKLLVSTGKGDYHGRLQALLSALRCLQNDQTFDESIETDAAYLDAAKSLATGGVRHVLFGHTHMAKNIPLPSGGAYVNSGTWADVMEFPRQIVSGSKDEALAALGDFIDTLTRGDFSSFALFRPTFVRLDVDASGRATPSLCRYTGPEAL